MPETPVFGCFSIGSIAATYEEIYVPRIFIPWARLLVDRARLKPAETVLDVATGPGTVARLAAEHVGRHGRVVGTDISPAMVDIARAKPIPPEGAPIEYLVAPAAPLPIDNGAFDVVTCQQGLQFFPDRRAALREMHRALKPGGRLIAAVWREIALQPSFAAIDAALRECLPAEAAESYGAPFRWPSAVDVRAALEDGGFDDVVIEEHHLPLVYEGGISQALSTLAASPVATTVAGLAAEDRARLWRAGERRLQSLVAGTAIRTQMVSHLAIASRR